MLQSKFIRNALLFFVGISPFQEEELNEHQEISEEVIDLKADGHDGILRMEKSPSANISGLDESSSSDDYDDVFLPGEQ